MGEYDPAHPDLSGFRTTSTPVEPEFVPPPLTPRPARRRRSPQSRVIGLVVTVVVAAAIATAIGAVVIPQIRQMAQDSPLASPSPETPRLEFSGSIETAIAEAALEEESVAYALDCPGPIWELPEPVTIRCIVVDPRDSRVGSTQVRLQPAGESYIFEYSAFDFEHSYTD